MRILISELYYFPELTGVGKYTGEMAEWLARRGHAVTVISGMPHYPEWRRYPGYPRWRYMREHINGVDVRRAPIWVPKRLSGVKRLVYLSIFGLTSFPLLMSAARKRPNVIIAIEPPLASVPAAALIGRLIGAKRWLHIQDFEVDAAFDLGVVKGGWFRRVMLALERGLMRSFDRVSTISEGMLHRLAEKGVDSHKSVLFENWVDTKSIVPSRASTALRTAVGVPEGAFVVLYSGNMGEKQGLEIVIESARRLVAKADVVFVMCGAGAAYTRLRGLAEGLSNIVWLDLQPLEKLNELLNMANVHVLPQRPDAADLVMPSKLTGMLASGRPVVATAAPGTQLAEVVGEVGIVVPPGDVDAMACVLEGLASDRERCERLGKAARQYAVEHLDIEAVLSGFEKRLLDCVGVRASEKGPVREGAESDRRA